MPEVISTKITVSNAAEVGGVAGAAASVVSKSLETLLSILKDVPILTSLARILKAFVVLALMPLIPLLKPVFEKLKDLLPKFSDFMKKVTDAVDSAVKSGTSNIAPTRGPNESIWKFIGEWILFALSKAFELIGYGLEGMWFFLKSAFELIGYGIEGIWYLAVLPAWNVITFGLKTIWEGLKIAWGLFIAVPSFIWDSILKPAFGWLSNVGPMIWDLIKKPFEWLGEQLLKIFDKIGSLLSKVGIHVFGHRLGGIITADHMAMLHKGERVVSATETRGQAYSINVPITVNNPNINSRQDIDALARELERRLQITMRRYTSYTP